MTDGPAVLIVADDLSGAADSAVALADRADTAVALDADAPWPDATVVSVDTDSRYLPGPAAAARAATAAGRAGPHTLVYKKIDSTLRGNIGPETAAVLSALTARAAVGQGQDPASQRYLAVVSPAFPATGRTVRDGCVLVHGEPIEVAHPGRKPLADQFRAAGLTVEPLGLAELREGDPARVLADAAGRVDAVIVDAVTDDDLARTVRACADLRVLLVGSAGLTHQLTGFPGAVAAPDPAPEPQAGAAGPAPETEPGAADPAPETESAAESGPAAAGRAPAPTEAELPVLICVGSRSARAQAQCRALTDGGAAVAVPVPTAAGGPDRAARRVRDALASGRNVLVVPDPGEPVDPGRAADVAAALASVARAGLPAAGALVATGGETARAVLRTAGVHTLRVHGELEPGVVLMRAPGGMTVVTKAGSFGDDGTLLRVVRSLAPCRPPAPASGSVASPSPL